ncbi:A/G-specific adenine glycosylase [Alkaliphilus crotonatoxidans]
MDNKNNFVQDLLLWFKENKRDVPWRKTKNPYFIWVSEIMLQQTRVETVIDYYQRFIEHFPTVQALAEATEEEVLKRWEGLGYYSRGRNLHRAAQKIVQEHGGKLPDQLGDLLKLPGIGDYTAGAIMSIAFNQAIPAVDGNVLRVFSRLACIEGDILDKTTVQEIRQLAAEVMPKENCGDYSEALMELGALICIPQGPKCHQCPVQGHCEAYRAGKQQDLPIRINKTKVKRLNKVVLWLEYEDKVLVKKNPQEGLLAGLWVLPTLETSQVMNEAQSLSGLEQYFPGITGVCHQGKTTHIFTHQRWEIDIISAHSSAADISIEKEGYQWITKNKVRELPLPTLYRKIINTLAEKN